MTKHAHNIGCAAKPSPHSVGRLLPAVRQTVLFMAKFSRMMMTQIQRNNRQVSVIDLPVHFSSLPPV